MTLERTTAQRLHAHCTCLQGPGHPRKRNCAPCVGADEIERLRAALSEIADYPVTQIPSFSRNPYEAQSTRDLQNAERRFRGPLQDIAKKALTDSHQGTET